MSAWTPEFVALIVDVSLGRGRLWPTPRRPPPARSERDREAEAAAAFARRLAEAGPDAGGRMVDQLVSGGPRTYVARVADAVAGAIGRAADPSAAAALAGGLARLGPAGVVAAAVALASARGGRQQEALAGVVERGGPGLPDALWFDVYRAAAAVLGRPGATAPRPGGGSGFIGTTTGSPASTA